MNSESENGRLIGNYESCIMDGGIHLYAVGVLLVPNMGSSGAHHGHSLLPKRFLIDCDRQTTVKDDNYTLYKLGKRRHVLYQNLKKSKNIQLKSEKLSNI